MSTPHIPGAVPPAPDRGTSEPPSIPISNDDIPTAPFHAVPSWTPPAPPATSHAPVPPPPPEPAVPAAPPAPAAPAGPVRRISATQRAPRAQGTSSAYAAAAPQPAPPAPRRAIPREPVPVADPGDWFGAAAQQQAAQQHPAVGYAPMPAAHAPSQHVAAGVPGGGPAPALPEEQRRQRLSPGWIAFIALDVVLLVVAVVVAWNVWTGPGPADEARPDADRSATQDAQTGGGTDPSAEPTEEAAPPTVLAQFASPSRNITCTITDVDVSCSIATLAQQPAPVDGCDGTVGYRVTVTGATGEVALPCVPAAEQPKAAHESIQSLEYGQSSTHGQFTCTSEQTGMSCKDDRSGKGFTLAKAGIGTF